MMTAASAAVMGFWGQLQGMLSRIRSVVWVETKIVQDHAMQIFTEYAWKNLKPLPLGVRTYAATHFYIRALKKLGTVPFEVPGVSMTFLNGWWPVFVSFSSYNQNNGPASLGVSYIRGTFNIEQALIHAAKNSHHKSIETNRYSVTQMFGSLNERGGGADRATTGQPIGETQMNLGQRLLGYTDNEIGLPTGKLPFQNLSYPDEVLSLREDIIRWRDSADQLRERGIPWRFGALLLGPPGTGKSSFIRAIAQELDVPVHRYDLASMSNQNLHDTWEKSKGQSPCVVLLEDFDRVFHGDKNMCREQGGLTLDSLLNCIGGVEPADGILLFITANDASKIDAAMGIPDANGDSTRPGRIERVVTFGVLTDGQREAIAKRILCDYPDLHEATVRAGKGETGAQFEHRCIQLALKRFWAKP